MKKITLFLFAILLTSGLQAQDIPSKKEEVGFAIIENVPQYPGCRGNDNAKLKKCMSDKVSKLVAENFDVSKIKNSDLGPGTYRVYVQFRINKEGIIDKIDTRADAPLIEEEAERVIRLIPTMKPGRQLGEPVGVLYSLPITFKIEEDKNVDKRQKF